MPPHKTIVLGTRGSELALWQARWVDQQLKQRDASLEIETRIIKTTGDRIIDSPLAKIGSKGLFTKEIEHALLDRTIDLAVHSLKDVPTLVPAGLALAAITEREDVRDVFLAHPSAKVSGIEDLAPNGTIATGSLRRRSQLLSWRPDLRTVDVRGNLNTRWLKLQQSVWSGMILAMAGVKRLGWMDRVTEILPPSRMLPAVGQGAMGIEIREDDDLIRSIVSPLHHTETAQATASERSLLRHLEGGCQIPIGALGRIEGGLLALEVYVGSVDGRDAMRGHIQGDPAQAELLGANLAAELKERGADRILASIRQEGA
ncbi:MAG: hydroxymethylbilane synthase [Ignavibacteria bacterium]|nr:hydroxymethylbilane synthase [Ignavibacteria bacterium]